ncbi:MAG: glycosyltransferase family 9 protein, partial [Candidatus Nitrosotenuis sp.]
SGPMHIAAAFDRPIVAIFGPTSPQKTGPVSRGPVDILQGKRNCIPCFSRACKRKLECMEDISPEEVFRRVTAMLGFLGMS